MENDLKKIYTRKNQLNNIYVMMEEKNFRDTRFYSRVMLGIEKEAKVNHYDLIVNFIDKDNIFPKSIDQGKAAGMIILGSVSDEYLNKAVYSGIPLVLADYASYCINTDAVLTQNTSGSYMAAEYLIKKGHRKIGFFGERYLTLSFNERWIGFCEAMRIHNIPLNKDYYFTDFIEEYVLNDYYEPVRQMLKSMKSMPTAWVCANDSAAFILIKAFNSIGISVPDDVSVIGFDDINSCSIITPNLTTLLVEKELMGVNSVKRLLFRMNGEELQNIHLRMPVKLIERNSVKDIS